MQGRNQTFFVLGEILILGLWLWFNDLFIFSSHISTLHTLHDLWIQLCGVWVNFLNWPDPLLPNYRLVPAKNQRCRVCTYVKNRTLRIIYNDPKRFAAGCWTYNGKSYIKRSRRLLFYIKYFRHTAAGSHYRLLLCSLQVPLYFCKGVFPHGTG